MGRRERRDGKKGREGWGEEVGGMGRRGGRDEEKGREGWVEGGGENLSLCWAIAGASPPDTHI